jgi:DNA-binding NtrC family response regulator
MFAETTIEILLIEDEEYDARRIRNTLEPVKESIRISAAVSNGSSAIELLKAEHARFDVIIMDFQIAGGIMGEQLIREIKNIDSSLQIIVVTKMTVNITDFEFANKLITAGAYWYCTKYPNDIDEYIYQPTDFILSIVNAYQKRQLEKEGKRSRRKLMRNIGDDRASAHDDRQVRQLAEQRAHQRGVGHGEGTGRMQHPLCRPAKTGEFCADQLRQHPERIDRKRTVRV